MNRGSHTILNRLHTIGDRFNEAPIHESGKSRKPCRDCGGKVASMRPRFMNRGSMRVSVLGERALQRFNEAPIHESGKSSGPPRWLPASASCFNEAPIHESGKYGSVS